MEDLNNTRKRYFCYLIAFFMVIVASLRPVGVDADSVAYVKLYKDYMNNGYINLKSMEPFFWLVSSIVHVFFFDNVRFLFIIYAVFNIIILFRAIEKYNCNHELAFFYYFCFFFILHTLTQIRVGVASVIFLYAIPDILERNTKKYFLKMLVASCFHYSALIAIPLFFLKDSKKNMWIYTAAPMLSLLIAKNITIELISFFASPIPKARLYVELAKTGTLKYNIYNVASFLMLFLFYIVLLDKNKVCSKIEVILVKILSLSICVYYLFSSVSTISVRLSEFLQVVIIILVSFNTHLLKEKFFHRSIYVFIAVMFLYNFVFKQNLVHIVN